MGINKFARLLHFLDCIPQTTSFISVNVFMSINVCFAANTVIEMNDWIQYNSFEHRVVERIIYLQTKMYMWYNFPWTETGSRLYRH